MGDSRLIVYEGVCAQLYTKETCVEGDVMLRRERERWNYHDLTSDGVRSLGFNMSLCLSLSRRMCYVRDIPSS